MKFVYKHDISRFAQFAVRVWNCDMNFAIVMGSEQKGVSATILNKSDFKIKIPMKNNFDSLNVANAASIVIYEALKQTMQKSENNV